MNDLFKTPNVIAQTSRHAGNDSQRLVDLREIVVHRMDCDHSRVILNLFAETIVSLVKRLIPIYPTSFRSLHASGGRRPRIDIS
ncbi:MAG: hypothetical protein WBX02_17600 [Terriglobales bacterium]